MTVCNAKWAGYGNKHTENYHLTLQALSVKECFNIFQLIMCKVNVQKY